MTSRTMGLEALNTRGGFKVEKKIARQSTNYICSVKLEHRKPIILVNGTFESIEKKHYRENFIFSRWSTSE
jgi:hypothetical protein